MEGIYSASYCENKRTLQDISNNFVAQHTQPESDNEETIRYGQNENRYLDAAKRRSTAQQKLRNKKIKNLNKTIERLKRKLLRYKKRYSGTKEKISSTPKTKMSNLLQTRSYESGHGKGVPYDIGAVCKRTADRLVVAGGDVINL